MFECSYGSFVSWTDGADKMNVRKSVRNIYLFIYSFIYLFIFFFNDTATTEIYTLSLHDALPICILRADV